MAAPSLTCHPLHLLEQFLHAGLQHHKSSCRASQSPAYALLPCPAEISRSRMSVSSDHPLMETDGMGVKQDGMTSSSTDRYFKIGWNEKSPSISKHSLGVEDKHCEPVECEVVGSGEGGVARHSRGSGSLNPWCLEEAMAIVGSDMGGVGGSYGRLGSIQL